MINLNLKQTKINYKVLVLLALSCFWVSFYPSFAMITTSFFVGDGNIFSVSNAMFASIIFQYIVSSLILWGIIELIIVTYKFFISFKIYSFVVPPNSLKNEIRTFLVYRNLIYGLFVNMCFIFPYLYAYSVLFDLIITIASFVCFSLKLQKNYSEPLIGHFVFNCFINPIMVYEGLIVLGKIMEVLS